MRVLITGKLPDNFDLKRTIGDKYLIRRDVVRRALLYLQARNSLYHGINISETALAELPENGIADIMLDEALVRNDADCMEDEKVVTLVLCFHAHT